MISDHTFNQIIVRIGSLDEKFIDALIYVYWFRRTFLFSSSILNKSEKPGVEGSSVTVSASGGLTVKPNRL